MHELTVTQSLLEIAIKHGKSANADRITDLFIVIGQLSSIIDDSVQFYWDFVSEGTMAEGAKLHFTRIPAKFQCIECTHEFEPGTEDFSCPECQSPMTRVLSGSEFYLESIHIDDNHG